MNRRGVAEIYPWIADACFFFSFFLSTRTRLSAAGGGSERQLYIRFSDGVMSQKKLRDSSSMNYASGVSSIPYEYRADICQGRFSEQKNPEVRSHFVNSERRGPGPIPSFYRAKSDCISNESDIEGGINRNDASDRSDRNN